MTTDDRKRDLIEQVAAALHRDDVEHGRVFVPRDEVDAETAAWYLDNASAAVDVFEAAQQPTDDDVEALWTDYAVTVELLRKATSVQTNLLRRTWMDGFATGFRRPVSPEPQGESMAVCCRTDAPCVRHRDAQHQEARPEPQGEPTDEFPSWPQVLAALNARDKTLRSAEGYPLLADSASLADYHPNEVAAERAALRAAAEEGKNRG